MSRVEEEEEDKRVEDISYALTGVSTRHQEQRLKPKTIELINRDAKAHHFSNYISAIEGGKQGITVV